MTRIGFHGAAGQMGLMLVRAITQSDKSQACGGLRPGRLAQDRRGPRIAGRHGSAGDTA